MTHHYYQSLLSPLCCKDMKDSVKSFHKLACHRSRCFLRTSLLLTSGDGLSMHTAANVEKDDEHALGRDADLPRLFQSVKTVALSQSCTHPSSTRDRSTARSQSLARLWHNVPSASGDKLAKLICMSHWQEQPCCGLFFGDHQTQVAKSFRNFGGLSSLKVFWSLVVFQCFSSALEACATQNKSNLPNHVKCFHRSLF